MSEAKLQLNYFENLENTIKMGLAVYLTILVVGCLFSIAGFTSISTILPSNGLFAVLISILVVSSVFVGFYYGIGKINWLGELHIRLDKRFFGFLLKSNNAIFTALVSALHHDDRHPFHKLSEGERETLTKSVLSKLSEDYRLFAMLLESGIFRSWIKYWVSIYGTFVFLVLTLVSFCVMYLRANSDGRMTFSICWLFALSHLTINVVWGRYMVRKTEESVRLMVDSHEEEIAKALQTSLAE